MTRKKPKTFIKLGRDFGRHLYDMRGNEFRLNRGQCRDVGELLADFIYFALQNKIDVYIDDVGRLAITAIHSAVFTDEQLERIVKDNIDNLENVNISKEAKKLGLVKNLFHGTYWSTWEVSFSTSRVFRATMFRRYGFPSEEDCKRFKVMKRAKITAWDKPYFDPALRRHYEGKREPLPRTVNRIKGQAKRVLREQKEKAVRKGIPVEQTPVDEMTEVQRWYDEAQTAEAAEAAQGVSPIRFDDNKEEQED